MPDCRILTFNRAAAVDHRHSRRRRDRRRRRRGAAAAAASPREPGDADRRRRACASISSTRPGDGRLIDLGLTVTTLAFPDGRPGYLFTFQDVTTMKRLERDARLQQRLAAVGEMAAGIAHEIRNPLASMSGSIQVLRQELPLSEEQAQLMDIVLRESERLNHTIGSFLAYARPQRAAASRLDVRTVVRGRGGAAAQQRRRARHAPRRRRCAAEPVWYEADENQIRQIVWNLATNGLRAMAGRRTPAAVGPRASAMRPARPTSSLPSRTRAAAFPPTSSTHLPAVPQHVREGHRPRPGHRPPHRHRLQRHHPGVVHRRRRHHGARAPAGGSMRSAEALVRPGRSPCGGAIAS